MLRGSGLVSSLSIASAAILIFCWVWYCYGFVRSCAVWPSPLQYALLFILGVGLMSGPVVVLMGAAQILMNRLIALRSHIRMLLVTMVLAVITSEGFFLVQDASLPRPAAAGEVWHARSFPFSFRKVGYNPAQGRYMCD